MILNLFGGSWWCNFAIGLEQDFSEISSRVHSFHCLANSRIGKDRIDFNLECTLGIQLQEGLQVGEYFGSAHWIRDQMTQVIARNRFVLGHYVQCIHG